ncbi:MAG TPA: methyltransferase [Acidimicrobiales bacterium]|nr:methyltransferase [Acidimicrobiales bacterium]
MTSPAVELRRMIFGHLVSQTVATVARLGVADRLSGGPRSAASLARSTGADPDALHRLLRAAAGLGLVEEVEPSVFALTTVGEWLRSDGRSLRDLAIALAGEGHWLPVERLHEVVMTGRPAAEPALGTDLWDYYRHHPEEGAAFAAAMGNVSAAVAEEVVARYEVAPFRRMVDVGGSHGVLLAALLRANPDATGVLFDRPEVVTGARDALARRGLTERVELVEGDFFEEVPSGGDLYLLKHILHDWDDERAGRILERCHEAAPPGATLLVVERLLGPGADAVAALADLLMMVLFGGRERTADEYRRLLAGAGWKVQRVVPLSMFGLVEATRA